MVCLDDGLTPADWYALLNERVFFWVDKKRLEVPAAQLKQARDRLVLVLDSSECGEKYGDQMELSPFNSGSTFYDAARRGPSTFTPLLTYDYPTWQRLRHEGIARSHRGSDGGRRHR